jgi:predicted nucleotidyltransferase component of viral defense system
MDLGARLRRQAQEEGVAEDQVLGAALARETLLWFFRVFPDLAIFVGGNVLHLLYGSPRYSRDVDLLPTQDLRPSELREIARELEQRLRPFAAFLGEPIVCRLRAQRISTIEVRLAARRVIELEFSRIAGTVRRTEVKLLQSDSLASEIVRCPILEELLLLKLRVLLKRRYFKARDVFDLWYLRELGAGFDDKEFEHWLVLEDIDADDVGRRLKLISARRLEDDLSALLPSSWLKTLRADDYTTVMQSVKELVGPFAER